MIAVIIPYLSELRTAKKSLDTLKKTNIRHEVFAIQGSLIANQRNIGVNAGKSQKIFQLAREGFTHFLFVDSDIGFKPKHLTELVKLNLPITSCPYLRHENDGTYQAGVFEKPGLIKGHFTAEQKGIIEVDFVGAGFLLVQREVFSKMRYPWFRYGLIEKNGSAAIVGEDIGFCLNALSSGFKIWCDFNSPVFHKLRTKD